MIVASAILLGAGYGPVTPASSHVLAKTTPPGMMSPRVLGQADRRAARRRAGRRGRARRSWRGSDWRVGLARGGRGVPRDRRRWRSPCAPRSTPTATPPRGSRRAASRGPCATPWAIRALRRLAICSFFFASLQLCLVTFLVTHLTLNLGFTLVEAGLMLSAAQAGGVVARIAWGAIADRWGRPDASSSASSPSPWVSPPSRPRSFTPRWPAAAIAVVCAAFGATAIGWNGVYLAQVARLAPPGKAGEATGGSLVFTYGGALFGPPAFTFLVAGGAGYAAAFVAAAVPAVACGFWLLWRDRAPRPGRRSLRMAPR